MQIILDQLGIKATVEKSEYIGTISRYYLRLHPGEKVSKIEGYATEIALEMRSFGKPIIKVITEKGVIIVEFLLKKPKTIYFNNIKNEIENENLNIPLILGRAHNGENLAIDLTKMPHLLVSGSTGSGKSVLLHSIISSILISNKNIKLAIIDPKKVEFSYYSKIKNLIYPIVTDSFGSNNLLVELIKEMEKRFTMMLKKSSNNILLYNKNSKKKLPYIVLIIDEFSDLVHNSNKEFQKNLCTLAQKSRACGIHIVLSTQRPSVDIITGNIKANFPSRISCRLPSLVDSRVIFGKSGAEKLLGRGDSIINTDDLKMLRFQSAYLDVSEILKICDLHKRSNFASLVNYIKGI